VLLVAASVLVAVLNFRRVGLRQRTLPTPEAPQLSVVVNKAGLPQPFDSATTLQRDLERARGEVVSLRKQLNQRTAVLEQARAAAADLTQRVEAEQDQLNQVTEEREALDHQIATAQAEVQSLRDKTATSGEAEAQRATQMAALEERVQNFSAAVAQKDHALAQNLELLAHDRDIRDLIGAQSLHGGDHVLIR
jgi:chromosome segregation ATPase